jgi:glycosyltransferase involved in cell wall biosynthesis
LDLSLPDYGRSGLNGWVRLLENLSPLLWVKLWRTLRKSSLVYVEAPSLEAFLACTVLMFSKVPLVMEMRAEMVLDESYMRARFGWKGAIYRKVLSVLFWQVRNRASGGLYINSGCMKRYPVRGSLSAAICDVELPDVLFSMARRATTQGLRILYVGNLEKVKRVEMIVIALSKARAALQPDWTFDIVGDGPEADDLKLLVGSLALNPNVIFHGRVEWGEALFRFYRETDIFLVASCSETGPRVLLEAMATGAAVISTRVGLAEEFLSEESLIPIDDEDAMRDRILRFAGDSDLRCQLSARNRNKMLEFRKIDRGQQRAAFWQRAVALAK